MHKVKEMPVPVVDLPKSYFALGPTKQQRQQAYAKYLLQTISEHELKVIRILSLAARASYRWKPLSGRNLRKTWHSLIQ